MTNLDSVFSVINYNKGFGQTSPARKKSTQLMWFYSVLASWFLLSLQNFQNKSARLPNGHFHFFSFFICYITEFLKQNYVNDSHEMYIFTNITATFCLYIMISHCACIKCVIYEYIQIYENDYFKFVRCDFLEVCGEGAVMCHCDVWWRTIKCFDFIWFLHFPKQIICNQITQV